MGVHGVLPEERVRPQPFEVDVELLVDVAAAGASDELEDTVDYSAVCEAVSRVVASEQYRLLERLASRIAEVCRADRAWSGPSSRCARCTHPCGRSSTTSRCASSGEPRAFLALGSNLGDRAAHLQEAVDALAADECVEVTAVSRVYETAPVGGPPQDAYLNAVVAIRTDLEPRALLALAQRIERDADRVRAERWGPRTLDVDILLVDDLTTSDPDLTLPHPRMWERGFVLAPLRDVAPELVDAADEWEGVREAAVTLRLPWRNNSAPSP